MADAADDTNNEWRNTVLQSYRNEEVQEIAKVLASLEPDGAASVTSKLMLAMRFEDAIFKSASSLADYRKKIQKRLKRLKKNYVPPAAVPQNTNTEEQLLAELRTKYADVLTYIVKNADKAIAELRARHETEKSIKIQQHTDSAKSWAKDLGLLLEDTDDGKGKEGEETKATKSSSTTTTPPRNSNSNNNNNSSIPLSESKLRKLQQHLDQRAETIRDHVVKYADLDLYVQETLERKDKGLTDAAKHILAEILSKRIQQLQRKQSEKNRENSSENKESTTPTTYDAMAVLQESLERAQAFVPPPTRNNSNDVPAALLHLDKMRAASTALMAYLAIPDRQTTAPRNALAKAYTVATQGMEFVKQVSRKRKAGQKDPGVRLEDVWTKTLELEDPTKVAATVTGDDDAGEDELATKRAKFDHLPPVIKSRVLLTPNRKVPTNLLDALRRKRATLIRPSSDGRGSYLVLDFGTAYTMTIYFSPLLVTIRAMTLSQKKKLQDSSSSSNSRSTATSNSQGCASWTPLHHGLSEHSGRNNTGTADDDGLLKVWGVTGNYQAIGHVVEERLRDASTHATQVLRKCFRNHIKDKTLDFEVEILEASALLEFLQLARTTYIPDWQDDEVTN